VTRDRCAQFQIAAARGALNAGAWAIAAALFAAGAGWWIASGWVPATIARVLLAVVSTVAGIAALWYAVRIEIDRRLFAVLADNILLPEDEFNEVLAGLDKAISDLGWAGPEKLGRPLSVRVRGTVKLLRASFVVASIQWLVVGVALIAKGF